MPVKNKEENTEAKANENVKAEVKEKEETPVKKVEVETPEPEAEVKAESKNDLGEIQNGILRGLASYLYAIMDCAPKKIELFPVTKMLEQVRVEDAKKLLSTDEMVGKKTILMHLKSYHERIEVRPGIKSVIFSGKIGITLLLCPIENYNMNHEEEQILRQRFAVKDFTVGDMNVGLTGAQTSVEAFGTHNAHLLEIPYEGKRTTRGNYDADGN